MRVLVGQPIDRVDGRLKITGAAKYAADYPIDQIAYGVPIQSTIAKGTVRNIDTAAAEQMPGVLGVLTRANAPKLHKPQNDFGSATKLGEARGLFEDDRVYYAGQYLGVMIADSLERAIAAANLVIVEADPEAPALDMESGEKFQPGDDFAKTNYRRGDAERALGSAAHHVRQTYTTPVEHHNPMEPSASMAVWDGNKLTMYEATQWVVGARNVIADTLGIPREDVHVISKFVGGGFGCKGFIWPHSVCAALAARHVGRPVKLVLTRPQMFTSVGHRGATRQVISLGSDASGKLTAIQHENLTDASMVDDFIERCAVITGFLYDCPNVSSKSTGVRLNIATPTPMRAPGETPGLFALECALDELAWELNLDPVELRLRNDAENDAEKGLPYSSKHLRECYYAAMQKFGWSKREKKPRAHRDGSYLYGWGMATATYPGYRSPGAARVRILPDGSIVVSSATQDIGTGTYTTLAQIAADTLGISPENIRVELGDSTLPPAPASGGSMTTASVMPAVKAAAESALLKLTRCALEDPNSPLHGSREDDITVENGRVGIQGDPHRWLSYADVLRGCKLPMLEAEARVGPGEDMHRYALHSFGAQFSEVRVDADTGEVRLTRHVAVFDVGRVINSKTARSQALGGITLGIGMALFEHTVYDKTQGRVVTNNLADYTVPVNEDVPDIDVSFVEYPDPIISPLGARGMGEIGITGVAPAIANAIYHATGIRVRDLPITPDKLLDSPLRA
jgi:xanthine dehydrogenase YagR molybdenum-binding subunit